MVYGTDCVIQCQGDLAVADTINEHVVDRLRAEIKARGDPLRKTAEYIGVSHSTIRAFCTDTRYDPSYRTVCKIAKALRYELHLV